MEFLPLWELLFAMISSFIGGWLFHRWLIRTIWKQLPKTLDNMTMDDLKKHVKETQQKLDSED